MDIDYICVSNERQSFALRGDTLTADDRAHDLEIRGVWGILDCRLLPGSAGGPPQAPLARGRIHGKH